MATMNKKLDSIGLRISPENKEIIRLAAEYMGQDMTSYLVSTALEKAKKDIVEHRKLETLLVSSRDMDKIDEESKNPRPKNEKLTKALKLHKEKFKE